MVAAVQTLYKLGLCRATMVYILVIGLLEHRTYMLVLMDAFVGIIGMVAEEAWEGDWAPSRPHGKPGDASADPKLICLGCQARQVHSSLGIGFICAALS
jgi:hypothetical protein